MVCALTETPDYGDLFNLSNQFPEIRGCFRLPRLWTRAPVRRKDSISQNPGRQDMTCYPTADTPVRA
jgi:hypothetical protein